MKQLVPLLALLVAAPAVARADIELNDKVSISGQFRPRLELDGRDFDSSTPIDQYATARTRLGFKVKEFVPKTTFFLLLADSRAMGYNDPYGEGTPLPPNQLDTNVGVVMAYLELADLVRPGGYLKIGRMDNNQGNDRLFGPGNWNYTGPRTFDGIKAGYRAAGYSVSLWSFYGLNGDRHWYPDPTRLPDWSYPDPALDYTHDHLLTGFDARFLRDRVQLLGFLDHDAHEVAVGSTTETHPAAVRGTVAVYGTWSCEKWQELGGVNLYGNLAYQFGQLGTSEGTAQISAWLATADVAYSLGGKAMPWGGLGIDATSGDRSASGGDAYYFYDDYYSKHTFRGHMDLFGKPTGIAAQGFQDLIARIGASPTATIKLQLDAHYFRTMKPFASQDGGGDAHSIGTELDFTLTYKLRKDLKGDVGIDLFLPSDDWQGPNADLGTFVYTTLGAEF